MIRRAVLIAVALIILTGASIVFLVALYHWLRRDLAADEALGVVAGLLLLVGLALVLIARQPSAGTPPASAHRAEALEQALSQVVASNPLGAALAAAIAGFVLDSNPALARAFEGLLRRK
jgi:hypothetical protein